MLIYFGGGMYCYITARDGIPYVKYMFVPTTLNFSLLALQLQNVMEEMLIDLLMDMDDAA